MTNIRDFAYQVGQQAGIYLWFVAGREMQFSPIALSGYLADRIPNLSIGAANQYIWMAAFAKSEAVMEHAIRQLVGLLPDGFVEETMMDELRPA
jgi:hypothetical protein